MTEAGLDRRITKLEDDMVDLGKCVVRLETNQTHIVEANKKFEGKQDEMLEKLSEVQDGVNSNSRVTFKWILEKIALPLLLGGGSVALTLYAVLKTLS